MTASSLVTPLPVRQVFVRVDGRRGERLPSARALEEYFGAIGELEAPIDGRGAVHIRRRHEPATSAYVHFATAAAATTAVQQLDGSKLEGTLLQTHRILWLRRLQHEASSSASLASRDAIGPEREIEARIGDEFRVFGRLDRVCARQRKVDDLFDVELVFRHKEHACQALTTKQGAPYQIDFEWRREDDAGGRQQHRRESSPPALGHHDGPDRQQRRHQEDASGNDTGDDGDDPRTPSDHDDEVGDGKRQRGRGRHSHSRSPPAPLSTTPRRRRQSRSRSRSPSALRNTAESKRTRIVAPPPSASSSASSPTTIEALQHRLDVVQRAVASQAFLTGGTWQAEFKIGQLLESLNARFAELHLPEWRSTDVSFQLWFDEVVKPNATAVAWVRRSS